MDSAQPPSGDGTDTPVRAAVLPPVAQSVDESAATHGSPRTTAAPLSHDTAVAEAGGGGGGSNRSSSSSTSAKDNTSEVQAMTPAYLQARGGEEGTSAAPPAPPPPPSSSAGDAAQAWVINFAPSGSRRLRKMTKKEKDAIKLSRLRSQAGGGGGGAAAVAVAGAAGGGGPTTAGLGADSEGNAVVSHDGGAASSTPALEVVQLDTAAADRAALIPVNLTTTRSDLETRLVLRLPRYLCVTKQYPRGCGIASLTSVYNYLYSWLGESAVGATRAPHSQEELMSVLGFEPPFGEIAWGPFTGNATLIRWFHALNRRFGVRGRAYILYKAHGHGKTSHLYANNTEALAAVKAALRDPHCALIYHCYNHYMVPIGYQDIPLAQTDFLMPSVADSSCETTIFIGEVSRGRHDAMYARRWSQIVTDIECRSPHYFNIRHPEQGVQRRVPKKAAGTAAAAAAAVAEETAEVSMATATTVAVVPPPPPPEDHPHTVASVLYNADTAVGSLAVDTVEAPTVHGGARPAIPSPLPSSAAPSPSSPLSVPHSYSSPAVSTVVVREPEAGDSTDGVSTTAVAQPPPEPEAEVVVALPGTHAVTVTPTRGAAAAAAAAKKERGNLHCIICFRSDEVEPRLERYEDNIPAWPTLPGASLPPWLLSSSSSSSSRDGESSSDADVA
ncbi:hypothetical protein NESM_000210900 [Novymonas esmeraldas]|uniref:Basic immunoglobulin-like variable motif-containing protein n=1 Tax=Novymonas esmeraldas TaxID=1808958 RepID=A0AAW0F5E4_9TRYP